MDAFRFILETTPDFWGAGLSSPGKSMKSFDEAANISLFGVRF
jgi:hypothetical protein